MPTFKEMYVRKMEQVGSSITCNPPVTDTDIDFLVFVKEEQLTEAHNFLLEHKWTSSYSNYVSQDPTQTKPFRSFRKGKVNYILTWSDDYWNKFMIATKMAKQFNLLHKQDRITLFEYVLYGNVV
jgi:hypothetical protein